MSRSAAAFAATLFPSPDHAAQGAFFAFAGIVTAATAWVIWGGDMFPAEPDPTGDPETWNVNELRRWLRNRNLFPNELASRDELLARVKANMRPPPRS